MIYKIVDRETWESATEVGTFSGSGIDLEDGYIHFSSAEQAQETADKHFAGQTDLLLVAVDDAQVGDDLKWEPSRRGELFPHLYGVLNLDQVVAVTEIHQTKDGRHLIDVG